MTSTLAAWIAACVGAAVMALELTAVRLLAPHFGDSAYVWTNVIGVILVGLALGAWLGGRLAQPERGRARLSAALWISAALAAVVPLLAGPVGSWLLPQDLPLDAAMPALVRGSFVATALLFAPPVVCVGCVSPLLIASLAATDGRVGRAAGAVGAASTLGSLVGTFAATHWLVPVLGSRWAIWAAALTLGVAAASAAWRPRHAAVAGLVWLGAVLGVQGRPLRVAAEGEQLLAERESRYQYLQVLERADGSRVLEINEGLDSAHSVAFPADSSTQEQFVARPFTNGWYYDSFAGLPYLAGGGAPPVDLRVLSLGDAAGTFARLFASCYPDAAFDGVELDPEVTELGSRWFGGFPDSVRRFSGVDARVFVEHGDDRYHLILVDAYENQVYIPAHVASVEFFEAVRDRLEPGGIVALNAGGLRFDAPVPLSLLRTMATVFEHAAAYRVPRSRNLMLVAGDQPIDPGVFAATDASRPELRDVLERLAQPGGWRSAADLEGGDVLVDDRPALDRMLEPSLEAAGGAGLAPVSGTREVADAVTEAQALVAAGDGSGARAALAEARSDGPEVRYWMGAARWVERDLHGAEREFEAAVRLAGPGAFADFVANEADRLGADLELEDRAAATATRNLWLALSVVAIWAVAGWLLLRGRRGAAVA